MRKLVAAINLTLDGYGDHTQIEPDEQIHQHYAELLDASDLILYGRTTYQLMQFWQDLVNNPSGEKSMDDFAKSMDQIPKLVFSHTLKETGWESARLATQSLKEEVIALKQQPGKDILAGSRSIIIQLIQLNLVDELQLCFHPVLSGGGLPLFENLTQRISLRLLRTKTFPSGAVLHFYSPSNQTGGA